MLDPSRKTQKLWAETCLNPTACNARYPLHPNLILDFNQKQKKTTLWHATAKAQVQQISFFSHQVTGCSTVGWSKVASDISGCNHKPTHATAALNLPIVATPDISDRGRGTLLYKETSKLSDTSLSLCFSKLVYPCGYPLPPDMTQSSHRSTQSFNLFLGHRKLRPLQRNTEVLTAFICCRSLMEILLQAFFHRF